MIYNKSDALSIKKTAEIILNKGIVIIPTDTVYGFSGIVSDTDEKIRKIKGRSETKPFIQLIAKPDDIFLYTEDVIPDFILSKWPGALTVIVNNKDKLSTTAYRCPGDEWLRDVIERVKKPIYSTSVNRSNSPVLSSINEIKNEFSSEVDLIINDGDKPNAIPSTIISITNGEVKIIRQGCITI